MKDIIIVEVIGKREKQKAIDKWLKGWYERYTHPDTGEKRICYYIMIDKGIMFVNQKDTH